jgi:hypothetical protein
MQMNVVGNHSVKYSKLIFEILQVRLNATLMLRTIVFQRWLDIIFFKFTQILFFGTRSARREIYKVIVPLIFLDICVYCTVDEMTACS